MEPSKPPPPSDGPTLVPESASPRTNAQTLTPPPSSFDSPTLVPEDPGASAQSAVPQSSSAAQTGSGVSHAPDAWSAAGLQPGTVLGGRYEIVQALGEGGMGAVYKARDRELDRQVALKVIRPDLARNPAIIQRFKQELILARQVTHRNVVRIFDLGEADGVKFITMEFIEGKDLRSLLLEAGKFKPEEAVETIRQVCLALDAAHSEGVIHRDLKPQNIMRDAQGRIVVMDFGLARSLEGDGMTQTGALIGTMEYMSPEQGLGQELDQRSDLFTLGLIFYELLSGQVPYKAETALASLLKRTQERAVPVSDLDGTVPRVLSNMVARCLERDPKLRYHSARELLSDLEAWQGKSAAASIRLPAVHPWAQDIRWAWLSVALVVLVLAITGYLLRGKLFGPSSTQQAAAKPEISLAIVPLRNASGDASLDWLGSTLAELLNTEVGQSARVRIVSPDRVQQVLADLRIGPSTNIDPTTLRQIIEFSGANTVVSGRFVRLGDQIRIDATLQDLKHDRSLPLKIEATSEKDIPGTAGRLAEAIRQHLAISPDLVKELKASSFQPSSSSAPALRDYNEGVQRLREGRNLQAATSFQAATDEDHQFALAYSRLAEADSALGHDDDAEQASRKAVELSQQLPLAEKYLIEAIRARIVRDNRKAIQAYENLSKTRPDDAEVQYALGALYSDGGDYDKARSVFAKILQANPKNIPALWQSGLVEVMSGNPQAALDPLTKGLSLAAQADNQEQRGLILLATGLAYGSLNKPDEALRNYQESLDVNTKIGQKRGIAADLIMMAQVYASTGKSDLALANYNRGLQIEQQIGARKESGDTLIELGNFHLERAQYDESLKMYKEALQIERDSGDENYQGLCLNNIGNVYLNRADYQEAVTFLQQALQVREKLNVAPAIADTLHNLGIGYANLGQDEEALSDFMRALDLYRKVDDKHGAASVSHSMAFLFERQARYGDAIKAMQDVLKQLRAAGDRGGELAQSLNDYASFLAEAGRGNEAGKLLDEAQGLAHDLKNSSLQVTVLNTRGNVLFYAANLRGAKAFYEQALSAASRGKQPEDVLVSRINLAKVMLEEGHSTAMTSEFARLGRNADAIGQRELSLDCSIFLAEAMLNSKDYTPARQQLQQSLATAEKLGLRLQSMRIHYLMGTSLRLSGDSAEAARQYGETLRLLEDIRKEPGTDHLLERSDLRTIYSEATHWAQVAKS